MIGNAPHSVITDVPGWETEAEQRYLVELASEVPDGGLIVEIGAEWGQSASLFAHATAGKTGVRIVSIDLFAGTLLEAHRQNLTNAGFEERTEQIAADSKIVAETWEHAIDLLFVDGDHTFAGALADLENWTPFVKVGGLIVVHDVAQQTNPMPHHLHYEVTRAISEWLNQTAHEFEPLRPVDTTAVWRRVKPVAVQVAEPEQSEPIGDEAHSDDESTEVDEMETTEPPALRNKSKSKSKPK